MGRNRRGRVMGYTMSLELDSEDLAIQVANLLRTSSINEYARIGTDRNNHGYAPDIDCGVFVSYSILDTRIHSYLWVIFSKLADEYDGTMYYDDEIITHRTYNLRTVNHAMLADENTGMFFKIISWFFVKAYNKEFKKYQKEFEELFGYLLKDSYIGIGLKDKNYNKTHLL